MSSLTAAIMSCLHSGNEAITDGKNALIARAGTLSAFSHGYLKATALIPALGGHTGLNAPGDLGRTILVAGDEFLRGTSGMAVKWCRPDPVASSGASGPCSFYLGLTTACSSLRSPLASFWGGDPLLHSSFLSI